MDSSAAERLPFLLGGTALYGHCIVSFLEKQGMFLKRTSLCLSVWENQGLFFRFLGKFLDRDMDVLVK